MKFYLRILPTIITILFFFVAGQRDRIRSGWRTCRLLACLRPAYPERRIHPEKTPGRMRYPPILAHPPQTTAELRSASASNLDTASRFQRLLPVLL